MFNAKEYFAGVVGIVEATSYEQYALWKEYHDKEGYNWSSRREGGPLVTVGKIEDRPICIALERATICGHLIVFLDATSELVDWRMIDRWLTDNLPQSAFDGKYVNKVDAMNFNNVFPR